MVGGGQFPVVSVATFIIPFPDNFIWSAYPGHDRQIRRQDHCELETAGERMFGVEPTPKSSMGIIAS